MPVAQFITNAKNRFPDREFSENLIQDSFNKALEPTKLISNLAEVLRITEKESEELLEESGYQNVVAQRHLSSTSTIRSEEGGGYKISENDTKSPMGDYFDIEVFPGITTPFNLSEEEALAFSKTVEATTNKAKEDPFVALYREDVMGYHDEFINGDAKKIDEYIKENFKEYPKYLLSSGIGGNEMTNHYVAKIYNQDSNNKLTWFVIDSTSDLDVLPEDASVENTLFMEFSRSGKTEETVKIHEFTPKELKRIVFANRGPLNELGQRDNNLVLELPDEVSGRFGRNKTPVLLANMYVAGIDTKSYWKMIDEATKKFDIAEDNNLPLQIAQFIRLHQRANGTNQIYLGALGETIKPLTDEFIQFWDEGVNKNGNDIMLANYLGLPRDSHTILEGVLANHKTKMGIFLTRDTMMPKKLPPLAQEKIDPINKDHEGLRFGDDEKILAEANVQRFAELMPTIKITLKGEPTLNHSAVIGQLWSDITYCYSRLANVDAGSNPEVKAVRDRSSELLAKGL